MIRFTRSFQTTDGMMHATLEDAQRHELGLLIMKCEPGLSQNTPVGDAVFQVRNTILDNKDVVVDILTTTSKSKPKARTINGGTKKRKVVITDADTSTTT
jgi:hypothetical protein